jgi:hypothetical protein
MAFGDAQGCYHTHLSKNGKCKKCGKQIEQPKPKDKEK